MLSLLYTAVDFLPTSQTYLHQDMILLGFKFDVLFAQTLFIMTVLTLLFTQIYYVLCSRSFKQMFNGHQSIETFCQCLFYDLTFPLPIEGTFSLNQIFFA